MGQPKVTSRFRIPSSAYQEFTMERHGISLQLGMIKY